MGSKSSHCKDKTVIWFGQYKGKRLIEIPDEYFEYLLINKIAFKGIKDYAKRRLKGERN